MKKLFFIIGLFFSLSAMAQPTNYTKINMRYRWLSGMFDSALYVPRYNGTPSGVRVNETSVFDGMVAMDTTNNRLYIYSGGSWVRLANYSEIAAYTATNGLTLSGSQFKLGGTLTEPTIITGSETNLLKLDGYTGANVGYLGIGTDFGYLRFGDGGAFSPTYVNEINGGVSEIGLKTTGDIYLDARDVYTIGVPTVSSTTGRKVALIDTATGKVERIDPATLVTTPTLQQVLTAGSTLTGDFSVATNGEFGIESTGSGLSFLTAGATTQQQSIINTTSVSLSSSTSSTFKSEVVIQRDSIYFLPGGGKLNIDSLRTWSDISDTTYKKPMTWDTRNGRWEYAANWYAPVTESNSVTLTNKRWTARVGSTTSSATPTINTDLYDIYKLTAQAADITSFTTNLSGTPNDGDILEIQITGTAARAITWGSSFVSTTVTLPTTTTSTNTLTVILQYYTTSSYGNNKWHCVNYY